MKKETIVSILFILVSIPLGIFLSMIPNTNTLNLMFQRIGHLLIIAGIFMVIREFSFLIRKKMHSQTFSELFSLENDMIEFDKFIVRKDNNEITFSIDLLFHYFNIIGSGLLFCVSIYIILPNLVYFNQELEELSEGMATWMIVFFMLSIGLALTCLILFFAQLYIISIFNIIKIIDVERQIFTIMNKKRNLSIPFSNLKDLEVWLNDETKIYYLIVPFINFTGEISLINSCRTEDSVMVLRDRKKDEFLLELKDSMLSFLTKFSF